MAAGQGSSYSRSLCSVWQGTLHVTCRKYLTGNCWLIHEERGLSCNYWRRGMTEFPSSVPRRWLVLSESSVVHGWQRSLTVRTAGAWRKPQGSQHSPKPGLAASWSTCPCTAPDLTVLRCRHTSLLITLSTLLCLQWLQIAHFRLAVRSSEMWSFLQSCPKTQWKDLTLLDG